MERLQVGFMRNNENEDLSPSYPSPAPPAPLTFKEGQAQAQICDQCRIYRITCDNCAMPVLSFAQKVLSLLLDQPGIEVNYNSTSSISLLILNQASRAQEALENLVSTAFPRLKPSSPGFIRAAAITSTLYLVVSKKERGDSKVVIGHLHIQS